MASASGFGEDFCLTVLTDDPALAAAADDAGVNRIGIDIETVGKAERQAGCIERHDWDGLAAVARVVRRADLFVRVNPIHPGTPAEIETALELGARVLMLPAFRTADEAAVFVRGTAAARVRFCCWKWLPRWCAFARFSRFPASMK